MIEYLVLGYDLEIWLVGSVILGVLIIGILIGFLYGYHTGA
jgi:hypothetical protein